RVGAGGGVAEAGATGNRGAAGPARAGEGPVESRVRENLMHGSEGGRWKRGDDTIRDRYPWAPARKGGNRVVGCKSYHRVNPPPRQRPTLPAYRGPAAPTQGCRRIRHAEFFRTPACAEGGCSPGCPDHGTHPSPGGREDRRLPWANSFVWQNGRRSVPAGRSARSRLAS